MARRTDDNEVDDDEIEDKSAPAAKAQAPGLGSWLEEAWHGWLKSVGGLLLLVVGYLLYSNHVLPESGAGRAVVALIIGGAIFTAAEPVWEQITSSSLRYALIAFIAVWAVVAVAPIWATLFPGKELARIQLGVEKDAAAKQVALPDGEKGPFEVEVQGSLKGAGEAEANYTLRFSGEGDSAESVDGKLERKFFQQRTSRRGTGSVTQRTEHTDLSHRIAKVKGPKVSVEADIAGESLENGLTVIFRRAGLNPLLFFALGFLLVIAGLAADYKFLQPKSAPTYVAMATAFTLVFALDFPVEGATASNLVRPAVAAALWALIAGALPGWAVSRIVGTFKPKPKKLAGVKT